MQGIFLFFTFGAWLGLTAWLAHPAATLGQWRRCGGILLGMGAASWIVIMVLTGGVRVSSRIAMVADIIWVVSFYVLLFGLMCGPFRLARRWECAILAVMFGTAWGAISPILMHNFVCRLSLECP